MEPFVATVHLSVLAMALLMEYSLVVVQEGSALLMSPMVRVLVLQVSLA